MEEIITGRLVLRAFRESDYDDLYEFLSQLREDVFEGYRGITYENGREHLKARLGSEEYCAIALRETGKVIGNVYCGNRDLMRGKRGTSSTGTAGGRVARWKRCVRGVRLPERALAAAAGKGGAAAGSAFPAKHILPQGRGRQSRVEGHMSVRRAAG